MFVIAIGNPFDGINLFGSERGAMSFEYHEEAFEYGENHFVNELCIVEIKLAETDEKEDTQ